MNRIDVYFLPDLVPPDALRDRAVVVIDVLRATTTIAVALSRGASGVVPCLEIDEARRLAERIPGALLGGEREGLPIEGFDFGNSPREYESSRVAGKTLVFTTTNGTRALLVCRGARRVVLGALVNLSAVCRSFQEEPTPAIVCAGTHGEITSEDVLAAGAMVDRWTSGLSHDSEQPRTRVSCDLNDQADLALAAWRGVAADAGDVEKLTEVLSRSRGGRNLVEIGLQEDIAEAARCDSVGIVPELDFGDGLIRVRY